MKISELMSGKTPQPDYKGLMVADNYVLALDLTDGENTEVDDYTVIRIGIQGLDPQLNAQTQDYTFMGNGTTTVKSGQQRSFAVTGIRYTGDEAQDFMTQHSIMFGLGSEVMRPYVYFNILTGKGEQGTASIIVNSDGGGNASEGAAISVDVKQALTVPTEYSYTSKPTSL